MGMIKSRQKSINEKNEKETQNEISSIKDGRFAALFLAEGKTQTKNHVKNKRTTHKKAKIGFCHTCFDNDTFDIVYPNVNGT